MCTTLINCIFTQWKPVYLSGRWRSQCQHTVLSVIQKMVQDNLLFVSFHQFLSYGRLPAPSLYTLYCCASLRCNSFFSEQNKACRAATKISWTYMHVYTRLVLDSRTRELGHGNILQGTSSVSPNKLHTDFTMKFDSKNWAIICESYNTWLILLDFYWKRLSNDTNLIFNIIYIHDLFLDQRQYLKSLHAVVSIIIHPPFKWVRLLIFWSNQVKFDQTFW
jgi:hypothetical protein